MKKTCDCTEWRRHVISPSGVACDCEFGMGDSATEIVERHVGHVIKKACD